ncbi:hypothetical protein C2G38_2161179 [Gigaspora rosea]|uniref:Uncharacterized protein n=1 Tax=Gigaspora rosea TaxID=44941 RepID=A0A397VX72_9GLOM|nr:hypothetical protein C2G38_2161179 [Gigaspora rosea]
MDEQGKHNKNSLQSQSKANKSKSQKVDTDDQSTLATLVITGLINIIVEHAKSKISLPNNNNNLESELQKYSESELQKFEYTSSVQEFEFEEFNLEPLEELDYKMIEESETEPRLQEMDMNEYIKIYTHLEVNTYKDWIKNILPNIAGANYIIKITLSSSSSKTIKKTGCKSYIRVLKCYKEDDNHEENNSVLIIHYSLHNRHNPGTAEDLCYFSTVGPLRTDPVKTDNLPKSRVNQINNIEDLESLSLMQKSDLYISYIDVYNIVSEEMKEEDAKIKECYKLFALTALMGQLCTNLFTLLIRDDDGGQGISIDYLISERKTKETLVYWLEAIKRQNKDWKPHTFLTDCDDAHKILLI